MGSWNDSLENISDIDMLFPHSKSLSRSLEFERFETPERAFRRKMPQEAY
jgi:hypothetical protein